MRTVNLSAGDIIEAVCTRCRSILNHTIVAMVGERVVRVECNTCHGVHNYRDKVEKKTPARGETVRRTASVPRKPGKGQGAEDRKEWESLSPAMDRTRAIPYDMEGSYCVNDLVAHPVFGLGVVKTVIKPNKIEVLFEQGKKLLRCKL
jgi:hypothetical protein